MTNSVSVPRVMFAKPPGTGQQLPIVKPLVAKLNEIDSGGHERLHERFEFRHRAAAVDQHIQPRAFQPAKAFGREVRGTFERVAFRSEAIRTAAARLGSISFEYSSRLRSACSTRLKLAAATAAKSARRDSRACSNPCRRRREVSRRRVGQWPDIRAVASARSCRSCLASEVRWRSSRPNRK